MGHVLVFPRCYSHWRLLCLAGILGSHLAVLAGFKTAMSAVFLSCLFWAGLGSLMGVIGSRTRKSTAELIEEGFGVGGGKLLSALVTMTLLGWFSVNCEIFGKFLAQIIGFVHGEKLLTAAAGLFMATTAIWGIRGLGLISRLAFPLFLFVILFGLRQAFQQVTFDEILDIEGKISLGGALSLCAGALMLGVIVLPDLTKHVSKPREAVLGIVAGYFVGAFSILGSAIFLSLASGQSQLAQILTTLAMGWLVGPVLLLSTWTTNDNNIFSASLALKTFFPKYSRRKRSVFISLLGTLLALVGIQVFFQPWLILLGTVLPPLAGVLIGSHFFSNKRPFISWISYLSGVLMSFLTTSQEIGGLGLLHLTQISSLDGILVSLLLMALASKKLALLRNILKQD